MFCGCRRWGSCNDRVCYRTCLHGHRVLRTHARSPEITTSELASLLRNDVSDDEFLGGRARSATDAGVLRRKGRLKEQDALIEFIVSMHRTHTCEETMSKLERWLQEHRKDPLRSKLKMLVPVIGQVFTDLPVRRAFQEYDRYFALSRRRYVGPNFAEIRHILNMAQVHASAESLQLITFDADGTLYADGCHMEQDNNMIDSMIEMMQRNITVAIVTAAGYPGDSLRFQQRVSGLLEQFQKRRLPKSVTDRFLMLGGECNYLLEYKHDSQELEFVDDSRWKTATMSSWSASQIAYVLDSAQTVLEESAAALRLPVEVIRKERAVGVVPQKSTVYEVLEDLAISVKHQLLDMPIPFCAFNGGADVFVDIGNKSLGLEALMNYVGSQPNQKWSGSLLSGVHVVQTLHVGDRFTASGNDNATRDCCAILWVASPEETAFFVDIMLDDINDLRAQPYIE